MKQSAKSLFIFGTAIVGGLLSVVIVLGVYALGGIPLHVGLISGALGGSLVGVAAFFVAKDLTKTSPPLSVTSDGTSGPEWINRLTKGGYHLSDWAKQVLQSDDFQPTNGTTHQVAILKGELFSDEERTTRNVRAEANKLGLGTPNPEITCLSREKLSDEELQEMGLAWIITMHEPIEDFEGDPTLLILSRVGTGRGLSALVDEPDYRWPSAGGFAFVAAQDTMD